MSLLSLTVGGADLAVSRVKGRFALSAPFSFDVVAFSTGQAPALADLLGQPFTLSLADHLERSLVVRGVVTEVERRDGGVFRLALDPEVAPLAVGRDSRVFQDMTVVDIVNDVLDRAGIPSSAYRWSIAGSYPKRVYCAQYGESDWAFIERLLAEEGVYYTFECGEDATVLVFADDSTAAPEIEGGAEIVFSDDDGLHAARDAVIRVGVTKSIAPDAVRLRDYNQEKPRLGLDAKAGSGTFEVYDFPGRFSVPAEGDRLARVRLEALRAKRHVVFGETSSLELRSGSIFELTSHPIESLNARYLLDEVSFGWREGQDGVAVHWTAIPASTPYRARRNAFTATPGGPQTGVVVGAPGQEIHPDKTGRIRVQLYWDRTGKRDDKASTWMRVGQFALGGSMIIPRIGWDVLVGHHEGDIDAPLVQTHLYDGKFPVPYALPANKTRTAWQTATTPGGGSTNEMRFEDKAGSEQIFINASKDMNVVVGDNKAEKVGVDCTEKIGSNLDVTVGSKLKVGIGSNQDVSIGASESLTISGSRMVNVGGSEIATIGASRSVTVIKGSNLEAKGGRTVTVGGSLLAASALGVNRMALGTFSFTVGGAWINAAGTGLSDMTLGACAETVGGAKINAGAAGCSVSVKGAAAETVGGAYIVAAGGNATESATGSLAITVGGAFLANAPSIEIEAESEISVRVGGASLTVKSGSVEVKAPTLASPGATIKKSGSTIKHN
jgi:type VI secretion system secreted protein VgrG